MTFFHEQQSSDCLWAAYGVIQCAIFFSETVRGDRGRQPSLINIPPLFVHMGLGGYGQVWLDSLSNKIVSLCMCANTHAHTHTNSDVSQKVNRGILTPPPCSPINGKANQISAANQHFISRAIWPSANCVSFKSVSISSAPPPHPLSLLKMSAFELVAFWPHGVACMGLGGCLLTTLS